MPPHVSAPRVLVAIALVALAGWCARLSWGGLRNLFSDYQDSPELVYIAFGAFWLGLAGFLVFVAVRLMRRSRSSTGSTRPPQ